MALSPEPFDASFDPARSPRTDPLRAKLIEAATAEFAERGYRGARVAEIARRAGVTTGAIYSRYRGKAELLAEAIDANTNEEFDALFADHRFQGRLEDVIFIAGSHLVDRAGSATPGMLLESFVAARHEPELTDLLRERMAGRADRLTGIIEGAKAGGGIDPGLDTQAIVTFCHAVGLGFLLLEVLDSPLPDVAAWEELIARLVGSVEPSAPAAAASPGD